MKHKPGLIVWAALAIGLCWSVLTFAPPQSFAGSATPVEGSKFDTAASLADNLKIYMGKNVYVHLTSGNTLQGYVKAVGKDLVHIEKLAGKDYFDALIRIDEITAIEARFREMK